MYELELVLTDRAGPRFLVGGRVFFVGRGRQCDLMLPDEAVSTRHLAIWTGEGKLFVEDLRSRNGTRVNGRPLTGRGELAVGDLLELGASARLRVHAVAESHNSELAEMPLVEDVASGALFPIRKERFTFGSTSSADVYLPDAPRVAAVLLAHAGGEVWLGMPDGQDRPVAPGEPFDVLGRAYRLRLPDGDLRLTRELVTATYPYSLAATLDGASGPVAVLTHDESGHTLELRAETRAVLLYLLGRKWLEDARQGVLALERGWLSEADAITGVWGRSAGSNPSTALNVLVWRVRKDMEARGFDPWCLEKRQRALRLRVARVDEGSLG